MLNEGEMSKSQSSVKRTKKGKNHKGAENFTFFTGESSWTGILI